MCTPPPLLKHDNEWKSEKGHEESFGSIKDAIRQITEQKTLQAKLIIAEVV